MARPGEWRRWITRLHSLAPLSLPTFASLETPSGGDLGEVEIVDGHYRLRICPRMDYCGVLETVIHEWAHCVRCDLDPDGFDFHDDAYWLILGNLYRAFHRVA